MMKLIIFPFDRETSSIARYKTLISDFELVGIAGAKGWGLNGKDASVIDGGCIVDIFIDEDFGKLVNETDAVLFLDSYNPIDIGIYKKRLDIALKANKTIILSKSIKEKLEQSGVDISSFELLPENKMTYQKIRQGIRHNSILKFEVPVILINGIGNLTNKFEIQLGLRKEFLKDGYKVTQLGTKEYSSLFGFQRLPDFLFNNSLSMEEKIIAFNHYLYFLNVHDHPDIIIIGVPKSIMAMNDDDGDGFGEVPYIIGSAAQADIGILSVYFVNGLNTDYLLDYGQYCKYTLKCPIDAYNIAHTNWKYNHFKKESEYLTIENSKVSNLIDSYQSEFRKQDVEIFSSIDNHGIREVYTQIIDKLQSNVEVLC